LRTEEKSLRQANGTSLSITRLAYLLTEFALLTDDGRALRCDQQAAYLNPTEGRTSFTLPDVPPGEYAGVAFRIGVPGEWNHRDASTWPAGHALNPSVNGLHWGWQGGFVFVALEGRYGESGGYSYHLARDENLATVRLPGRWKVDGETGLTLRLEVSRLLPEKIESAGGGDSTHSAAGDPVAARLRQRIPGAFEFRQVAALLDSTPKITSATAPPAEATPYALHLPAGFPQPSLPTDNPLTVEGIALGRRLFSEKRLSINSAQSCASCHRAERAFAEARAVSIGAEGHPGTLNAPSLTNLAWQHRYGWEGRRTSLREQILAPFSDAREFHQPVEEAVAHIAEDYAGDFARAFGSPGVTADRLARALEQFLLAQVAGGDSKFDRSLRGQARLSADEARGFELFQMEYDPARGRAGADCFHCHGGPLFSDFALHDTGLAGAQGRFKTPSLRNLGRTGPYMHDGRFATVAEVIAHYDHGVQRSEGLDPNLAKHPAAGMGLSDADQRALVAFLGTLEETAD
jgi:cytochrome c peroxidase